MSTSNTQVRPISRVLERKASRQAEALAHFRAKLENETDPSDVYFDLRNGETNFSILDVRPRDAFDAGHVPGAINMPHRTINERTTAAWPKDKLIVVYCYSPACNAAAKAAIKLIAQGFITKEMIGGIEYWIEEGYPLQKQGEDPASLTAPVLG